jgi:ferritin-like metal-binding protein YciE
MASIDREDPAAYQAGRGMLIQYLNEAHATEDALVRTLQAHIALTPRGPYRDLLEHHLTETRGHARAVEQRLTALGASGSLIGATIGLAESVVGQAIALAKSPLDVLRGHGGDEKLLKNAKDECATEALEIATYDALETLAGEVGDTETAELAARHRADEERMLAGLRELIPNLTRAAAAARTGGKGAYRVDETGAADAVRAVTDPAPWPDYAELNAGQVVARLGDLPQAELTAVAAYERANRNRRAVLERVDALTGEEPWPGYDTDDPDEILRRVRGGGRIATRVRDYEARHRRRVPVLEAAQRELAGS